MKQEDFDRLKALCQENDFEIDGYHPTSRLFIIDKKDPWDGVEFGEVIQDGDHVKKGQIFKLLELSKGLLWSKFNHYRVGELGKDSTIWISQEILKPSTESAYVEQLKKEAFERFGKIKEGQIFIDAHLNVELKITWATVGFVYSKYLDALCVGGVIIYKSGKWATRVNERIEVKFDGGNLQSRAYFFMYGKDAEHKMVDLGCFKVGEFLASQLEKYLNNEIE